MSCRAVVQKKTRTGYSVLGCPITVQSLSSESNSHYPLKACDEGQCLHEQSFENLYEYKVIDTIIKSQFSDEQ